MDAQFWETEYLWKLRRAALTGAMFTVIDLVHALVSANVVAVHVLEVAIVDEAEVREEDAVAQEVVVLHQEDAGLEEGVIPAVREAAAGHPRRSVVPDVVAELRSVTSVHQKALRRRHQAEALHLRREEAVVDLVHQLETRGMIQLLLKEGEAALLRLRGILSVLLQKK